jgi:tetratricopeptide (TPR) repeat protein
MTLVAVNADVLRQGWDDAVSAIAPNLTELSAMLAEALDQAERDHRLDEESLLGIVDEAAAEAAHASGADVSHLLRRRLQRAVYEYLLSLDALAPEETKLPTEQFEPTDSRDDLIGAEEVAELAGRQAHRQLLQEATEADRAWELAGAEVDDHPPIEVLESLTPEPQFEPVEPHVEAQPAAAAAPAAETEALEPGPHTEPEPQPEPELQPEVQPEPPPAHRMAFTVFSQSPGTPGTTLPATVPAAAEPVSFAVAPRDGFHLTDYPDLLPPTRPDDQGRVTILDEVEPLPPPLDDFTTVPQTQAASDEHEQAEPEGGRGWHIRRSGRDHRSEASKAAPEALEEEEDDSEARIRFENDPAVIEARRQITDRLRRRRCDEAASLLQKLAADVGGRLVSELALDAGDRCRALGKANAALSCYLAASRADPVHEPPLMRLADICLDDRDIELAVSYLERVARLRRMREDLKGALRIYRKIATVAPYRDDILAVLMRAQSTGSFDE